jgi:phospholipid transport system substrate-binding protein
MRLRLSVTTTALLVLTTLAPARGAEESATRIVERLNAAIGEILPRAVELGYEGRFQRLKPVIEQSFDVEFMAEKSVGRHWKELSDEQKKEWVGTFRDFMVANYAANLDKNTGQKFEVIGEEKAEHDTTLVKGRVVDPAAPPFALSYRLHPTPKGPRIIDVQIKNAVSELALRRADFTSLVARDGFAALLTTLRARIADLAAGRVQRPAA